MVNGVAADNDHRIDTSSAAADGAKQTKKKRSSSKGGRGNAAEADRPLPEAYRQLLDLFMATDHAYCFLVKHSIPPRVSSLQSMVWRLFPGRFGDEGSFLPRLRRLADVACSVLTLDEPPAGEADRDLDFEPREVQTEAQRLELFFPQKNTAGTGKTKVSKRQQLVRQALLKHADGRQTDNGANTSGGGGSGSGSCSGGSSDVADRGQNSKAATKEEKGVSSRPGVHSPSGRGGGDSGEVVAPGGGAKRPARSRGDDCGSGRRVASADSGKGKGSASRSTKTAVSKARTSSGRRGARGGASIATTGQGGRPPATGTALLLSDPLSQSPAYVAYERDECAGAGEGGEDGQEAGLTSKERALTGNHGGADGSAKGKRRAAPDLKDGDERRLRFDPLLALDHLKSLPIYEGQAVYSETFPGREGEYAKTAHPLHPELTAALAASKGVTRLFKHQALAIDAAVAGQHVALSTATSSGKSVVFNVSVIEAILGARPAAVALYLFPTKALAQDQLRSLKGLVDASPYLRQRVRPMTLDGDTPFRERGVVTEEANIILTNPDMLHASVLPGHKKFRRILANLSHVVIDEAHVYRGAFGAHVSMVLRRLLRLWSVNAPPGPPPQFICCSATMRAAPSHFASLLPLEECLGGRRKLYFGSADTAPTGRKTVVLWRPPVIAEWYQPPEANGKTPSAVALRRGRSGRRPIPAARGATASPTTVARPRRGRKGAAGAVSPATADPLGEAGMVTSTAMGERPQSDASTSAKVTATTAGRAEDGAVGGCTSHGAALRGLDNWRKGPTDNFYNKEYMKLMGAELPRRSSGRAAGPKDGTVDAKTPPRAAKMARSAEKETSGAGAEDGGIGSARRRHVDGGDSPRPRPGGNETGSNSKRVPAAARLADNSACGSPDASLEGVGVGASSEYIAGLQAEELNSNAVALEASRKGMMEGAEAGGGAADGTATGAMKEGGAAGQEDGEGQGEDEPGWEDGRRRSPICETAQILAALVKQRVRTLAFCRTRKLTELTLRYGLQDLEKTAPHMVSLVQGYRGGYTKYERRKIEGRLFANELLGVTATCALELGVDIGELDVTLHLGFPGSVSSLRQQAGRAGRGGTDSLTIMVIFQDPISQFFVRNPKELFHKEPEAAVLDSTNELVLRAHVLCAAAECPLGVPSLGDVTDAALFGGEERLQEVISMLTGGDFPRLVRATGNLGWKSNPALDPPPCRRVGLRMIDPVSFSVVDDLKGAEPYDTVEYSRAFFSLFEGAIYLHQARQYVVTKLDLARHVAHTIPVKVNYYTAATNNVDVNVTKRLEVSEDNHAHTGCVDVVCTVYGFVKKQLGTGRTIERGECSLPPLQYATRAFWLDVGVTAKRKVEEEGCDFEGGVHAVGHALLAVVPLFLLCDAEDVDCEHAKPQHNRPQPQRILVYDKRPGGVGVSDAMFGCHRAVMSKALELVEGCPCPEGCLACIHDHGCTGYNSIIDKRAALIILKRLIQDMMEAGQAATEAKRVGEEEEETRTSQRRRRRQDQGGDGSARNSGGFFLDRGSSEGDPDASVNGGCREGNCEGDEQLGVDAQHKDGGGNAGVGTDDDLISSPRKKQRLRNLRVAKGMERARENNIAVVGRWIPSVP